MAPRKKNTETTDEVKPLNQWPEIGKMIPSEDGSKLLIHDSNGKKAAVVLDKITRIIIAENGVSFLVR